MSQNKGAASLSRQSSTTALLFSPAAAAAAIHPSPPAADVKQHGLRRTQTRRWTHARCFPAVTASTPAGPKGGATSCAGDEGTARG